MRQAAGFIKTLDKNKASSQKIINALSKEETITGVHNLIPNEEHDLAGKKHLQIQDPVSKQTLTFTSKGGLLKRGFAGLKTDGTQFVMIGRREETPAKILKPNNEELSLFAQESQAYQLDIKMKRAYEPQRFKKFTKEITYDTHNKQDVVKFHTQSEKLRKML